MSFATSPGIASPVTRSPTGRIVRSVDHEERASLLWLTAAAFMLAGLVAVLPATWIDARTLGGASVWDKPLKFWPSIAVHFTTLALLARLVEPRTGPDRAGALLLATAYVSIAAGIFEVLYITFQAARGHASHFNVSTALEGVMYGLMGVGAVTLVTASFIVGALVATGAARSNGLRLGAAAGLMTGSVLTLGIAGFMSVHGSHYYGTAGSDIGGLPFVGWSTTLPDMRPAHFVATHLMQALPLLGLAADRFAPSRARVLVGLATVAGAGLAVGLFGMALSGRAPAGWLHGFAT